MKSSSDRLYSVLIPVGERVDDLPKLVSEYEEALVRSNVRFEVIVILDGSADSVQTSLRQTAKDASWLKILRFSRRFGESVAFTAGFKESNGDIILTLPAYWQIDPNDLVKLIESEQSEDDMLIAVRWPRVGSSFEHFRRNAFHALLKWITGQSYRDLGCGVRLMKRAVMEEIALYGDQHRFLPVLAVRRGFRVREVEVTQSANDRFQGRYPLREYLHRFLDILTVFFLVRFTKKPLRFFGSLGFLTVGIGALTVLFLIVQRLFFDVGLADRPALLLGSLLIVLGVQLFALGLLGELVIFSHAAEAREYAVRSIVQSEEKEKSVRKTA